MNEHAEHPKRFPSGRELMARRRPRYAQRFEARLAVRNAAKRGELVKPDRCQDCDRQLPPRAIQAHHSDYAKPLEVEWLCQTCHTARHHG